MEWIRLTPDSVQFAGSCKHCNEPSGT